MYSYRLIVEVCFAVVCPEASFQIQLQTYSRMPHYKIYEFLRYRVSPLVHGHKAQSIIVLELPLSVLDVRLLALLTL